MGIERKHPKIPTAKFTELEIFPSEANH